jgi:hypothetical protein
MAKVRAKGLLSRVTTVATGLTLSASLVACASAPSNEPAPLAVQTLGKPDGKYNKATEETRRLAGLKGVWRRGEVLTVDTEEGIQYRLVDAGTCEGSDTCRRWEFRGSAQSSAQIPENHLANYWLIQAEDGESGYVLAIGAGSGTATVLDFEPVVSPDKRFWATGECDYLDGRSLKLLESGDFGLLTLIADAENEPDDIYCCEVQGWDGAALNVKTCDLEPGKAFTDRLVRQADGRWVGKRLRLGRPKVPR